MFDSISARFRPTLDTFFRSRPVLRLMSGDINPSHYRAVLREIFHHTRENPQLQALATVYFRGRQRDLVRSFLAHAASEIGHDQLALNDFVTMGGDARDVPYQNPLPATTALISFGFYQVYNLNPLGYLGYLFFLEFMPTNSGAGLMSALAKVGIPSTAMTFLRDHTEIDIGHNKLMRKYVDGLVASESDIDTIDYAMKTTGFLYAQMLDQAISDADAPSATGWNWEEALVDNRTMPPQERQLAAHDRV